MMNLQKHLYMTIEEGNKLIASFMGATIELKEGRWHGNHWSPYRGLSNHASANNKDFIEHHIHFDSSYHESWDWLMPVVEKIEGINEPIANFVRYSVETSNNNCYVYLLLDWDIPIIITKQQGKSKIEAVWHCCIKFIEYYNGNTRINTFTPSL